jgi:hypothetical protein
MAAANNVHDDHAPYVARRMYLPLPATLKDIS